MRRTRILRTAILAAVLAGILLSGVLVWGASSAAFSGVTGNPADSWSAGSVTISDDDGGAALVTVSGLMPGDSGDKCITVTYTGNVAAAVRLYATGVTGTLGTYLDATIEQGNGGSFGSCTSFVSELTSTSTLAAFTAARTSYATGFGTWAPTGAAQTRTYRIAWSMRGDNAAVGTSVSFTLNWTAQST